MCARKYMYLHGHTYMCVGVYLRIHICVCIYVCIIYLCMCIHTCKYRLYVKDFCYKRKRNTMFDYEETRGSTECFLKYCG